MCSKSCDGGLSNQKRRCYGNINCAGPGVRYRHCNTIVSIKFKTQILNIMSQIIKLSSTINSDTISYLQPCSGYLLNDNARICNVHNSVGSTSAVREWSPISEQTYPCFVLCHDLSGNTPNEIRTDKEDGTKCGSAENFYCIQGECKVWYTK